MEIRLCGIALVRMPTCPLFSSAGAAEEGFGVGYHASWLASAPALANAWVASMCALRFSLTLRPSSENTSGDSKLGPSASDGTSIMDGEDPGMRGLQILSCSTCSSSRRAGSFHVRFNVNIRTKNVKLKMTQHTFPFSAPISRVIVAHSAKKSASLLKSILGHTHGKLARSTSVNMMGMSPPTGIVAARTVAWNNASIPFTKTMTHQNSHNKPDVADKPSVYHANITMKPMTAQ
mmetsp:Transcript_74501/g.215280  ORF Transcript_74501/g.215280 Transcript_74501/m.215280 type:complete len:234 (+) Transcript_74501:381-1082(+)